MPGLAMRLNGLTGIRAHITEPARILSWRRFPEGHGARALTGASLPIVGPRQQVRQAKSGPARGRLRLRTNVHFPLDLAPALCTLVY
jgi:hypothetical protein